MTAIFKKPTTTFSALAGAILLSYCSQSAAAIDKRWFEVEVILFSQLGDKSNDPEIFDGKASLPNYRKVVDLLTPYLYPDTDTLRLQLPSCETRQYPANYLANVSLPPLHSEKSLEDIEQDKAQANEFSALNTAVNDSTENNLTINSGANSALQGAQSELNQVSELSEQNKLSEQRVLGEQSSQLQQEDPFEVIVELTEQQRQLVIDAESYFASHFDNINQQFSYHALTTDASNHANNQVLCQTTVINERSTIADYLTWQKGIEQINALPSYPIDELSGIIDNPEFVDTDKPYLISADSLKLIDITTQLRRSRDFKPLLHLGWRQSLINRRNPAREPAIRLFAGEHYGQQYQQALSTYQEAKAAAEYAEWQLQNPTLGNENSLTLDSPDSTGTIESTAANEIIADTDSELAKLAKLEHTKNQLIQQKLNELYQAYDQQSFTVESTIAELKETPTSSVLQSSQAVTHGDTVLIAPQAPNQNWFVEGLFRLHLSHYLFITADFNVAVPYSADKQLEKNNGKPVSTAQQTAEQFQFKLVPFSQNKRVISTEIHYFDHPYIGMIVQIRRYEKPEPEQAENQE